MVSTPRLESADDGDANHLGRGFLAGRHTMRSLLMTGFLLVAVGIVAAQPPGTYGVKTKVAGGAWHTLRADFSGSEFTVLFDGQRLFSVRDDTFAEAGKVGIWSKADSVTEFERPQHGDKS